MRFTCKSGHSLLLLMQFPVLYIASILQLILRYMLFGLWTDFLNCFFADVKTTFPSSLSPSPLPPPPPPVSQEYFLTVLDFLKLEKVEFGGVKGRCLSEMVSQIFNEFQELMNKISSSSYDPLDLTSKVGCCGKLCGEDFCIV